MGHTYIGVPNLGARWSRFLTVTLMMVWVLVYGSYIQRWQIWVQDGHAFWQLPIWWCECWYMGHTYIHTCLLVQVWINSSPSLSNHCLWYGKLWGPSQRVVTLFYLSLVNNWVLSLMHKKYVFAPLSSLLLVDYSCWQRWWSMQVRRSFPIYSFVQMFTHWEIENLFWGKNEGCLVVVV